MKTEEEIKKRLASLSDYDRRDYSDIDAAILEEKIEVLHWVLGD